MMALQSAINNTFRNAFEQKCFQLILEAYTNCLCENVIQLDWNENDISQELLEKIDSNPLRLKWNITGTREYSLTKKDKKYKGFADKLPRIDFRLSCIFSEQEFIYFFEAKRLKGNDSSLKRAYINEGMDRFISKKYPQGCMLGYLLEGTSKDVINGINFLLIKDNRKSEILYFKNTNHIKTYCESSHSSFRILKHLILNFTNNLN